MRERSLTDTSSPADLNMSSGASERTRVGRASGDAGASGGRASTCKRSNPLLNIPIGRRLALGFLLPALIAALTLSSMGTQSQQRLLQEATFYQHLFDAYTSLTTGMDVLGQMHLGMQAIMTYAAQPHALSAILTDDERVVGEQATRIDTILSSYLQQDVINHNTDLVALFTEAGHTEQIAEQQTYSDEAQSTWRAYRAIQAHMVSLINTGKLAKAEVLLVQENTSFSDGQRDLQALITFNETLLPSLHDAASIQVQKLLISTLLAVTGVLLGIGLVGWLVSSTLVRRLRRLRSDVQAIANGQVETRLDAGGRDEIAQVSEATNAMVETLVGLLEETRQQRDELARGEELKHLHEELQKEQEALKEANAHLERLSTTDMLTELPNHRALQVLLEKECERARRFGHPLSLLFFDGDRFKQVNDTYGHAIGDVVLRELGERAKGVLRAGDTVGRFGGEEFLMLLPETDTREAQVVAERLRSAVSASPLATHAVADGIALTVSIGLASYPVNGASGGRVRELADQAMYWAKRLGRNQVRTAAEAERANRDAELKAATAHALQRPELTTPNGGDYQRQIRAEQLGLIYSLMGVLDVREPGISERAHKVSDLVSAMAQALQFDEVRTQRVAIAAFLHDIGKIALPDRLLERSQQLFSAQEWRLLHQHAELGASIVEASPWLCDLAPAIRSHHECWDGTGGPDGLAGEAIPLEARLIAVVAAYHAMIAEQPYQTEQVIGKVLEELECYAGIQFDPVLLPVFRVVLERQQERGASLRASVRY